MSFWLLVKGDNCWYTYFLMFCCWKLHCTSWCGVFPVVNQLRYNFLESYFRLSTGDSQKFWIKRSESRARQPLSHVNLNAHAVFRQRSENLLWDGRALLTAICHLESIFGLCVLKIILSNTNSLCRHLQGKTVDVISSKCRHDHSYPTPVSEWRNFQRHMADNISSGSENEEVADQFSVWITRSQGTQTHPIAPPSSPCG